VRTVVLDRPGVRNAVDASTADALVAAFEEIDADPTIRAAVLWGAGGTFCAGADLAAIASGQPNRLEPDGPGPMGPTRMRTRIPVVAAVSGYAVAGGLELALWCDLRVVEQDATFGVFCRRWGVPLIDGGTVRLPRIVGQGRALDMILTGRAVGAAEALSWGLADRVVARGTARAAAEALAAELAALPPVCLRNDRASVYDVAGLPLADAMAVEFEHGLRTLASGEAAAGAGRFAEGAGRHGAAGAEG
jgi:enoyl-CoA hydratase